MILLTTTEAARFLGKHPGTLANWRQWSLGPRWTRLGKRVMYRKTELQKWQKQQPQ